MLIVLDWPQQDHQADWVENFELVQAWLIKHVGAPGDTWDWHASINKNSAGARIEIYDDRKATWALLAWYS